MDSAHLGHCVYAGPVNRDSGERPPGPKQPFLPTSLPNHGPCLIYGPFCSPRHNLCCALCV